VRPSPALHVTQHSVHVVNVNQFQVTKIPISAKYLPFLYL